MKIYQLKIRLHTQMIPIYLKSIKNMEAIFWWLKLHKIKQRQWKYKIVTSKKDYCVQEVQPTKRIHNREDKIKSSRNCKNNQANFWITKRAMCSLGEEELVKRLEFLDPGMSSFFKTLKLLRVNRVLKFQKWKRMRKLYIFT